ncbi:MAG: hypothetical protein QGI76_00580 [Dehalococcoidia bacterium]|nr:hypothetical protein [Dehalococcoidia bacterium]
MLRLKHSPDNNWTRYGDLSLSGASGDGPDLDKLSHGWKAFG